jgi:hypothetical protein
VQLLPRTPDPGTFEGIYGYILRVSERNGYETPWHVLSHAGYVQGEMQTAAFCVEKLAAVLGKSPDALRRHAYRVPGRAGLEYGILGVPMGAGLNHRPYRLTRPAVCVECVVEMRYADACWDLRAFVACPRHRRALICDCQTCGEPLRLFRPGLLNCRCGARFQPSDGERPSEALIALMQVLQKKTRNEDVLGLEQAAGLPMEWLARISLGSLLRLSAASERVHQIKSTGPDATMASPFAAALADWPNGFHALLRRLASETARGNQVKWRERLAPLYAALFMRRGEKRDLELLRKEFWRFGYDEWGEAAFGRKNRCEPLTSRYLSGGAAARQIGIRPITVQRWIDRGLLVGKVVSTTGTKRYVVDGRATDSRPRLTRERMGEREAGRYAQLPVSVLRGLRNKGYYSTHADVNGRVGYWPFDLDDLRTRLVGDAREAPAKRCAMVSFDSIMRFSKFGTREAKVEFVRMVLQQSIRPMVSDGHSLESLMFAASDVEAFRIHQSVSGSRQRFSIAATASLLGVGQEVVRALARSGKLLQCDATSRGSVSADSALKFNAQWTSLRRLAKSQRRSETVLRQHAQAAGLELCSIATRYGESSFVRSDAAERLLH